MEKENIIWTVPEVAKKLIMRNLKRKLGVKIWSIGDLSGIRSKELVKAFKVVEFIKLIDTWIIYVFFSYKIISCEATSI